ncbi:MAG: hypothetical protein IJN22_00570 [Clostridia bacterium]|nr:hypothetical protein [Clostridia bacterium]
MKLKLKDIVLLALLAALMCVGDFAMEWLPNVHFVGVFIVVTTVVYRKYALLPIFVYWIVSGFVEGISLWWIPKIYIWSLLWVGIMLIPKSLSEKVKNVLYVAVCTLHGFLSFGVLYAPAQALITGLDFKGTIAWIIAGLPFDVTQCIGNLVLGSLVIYPMIKILKRTDKYTK